MANQDQWRKLRQRLRDAGLEVLLSKKSHYKVYRGKQLVAVLPNSSGGGRGYNNALADLKRRGVNI